LLSGGGFEGAEGFSSLVRDALDEYLLARKNDAEKTDVAQGMLGALDADEAGQLADACLQIRSTGDDRRRHGRADRLLAGASSRGRTCLSRVGAWTGDDNLNGFRAVDWKHRLEPP
jgi:hypothetical protein